MATAAEAAQDLSRVLRALVKARQFFAALDRADALRDGSTEPGQASGMHQELDLAEKAGERVYAYLTDGDPIAATTWRDGGPM